MDKCIFCSSPTSFRYDGNGEYHGKVICPRCQVERFATNFNSGCGKGQDCSIRFENSTIK